MEKLYVVYGGDYIIDVDGDYVSWSCSDFGARHFLTYSKAYALAQKANRKIGWKRCIVVRLNKTDFQPYWWDIMVKNAI